MSNTPSDPHLASFKRPENDNGRGLHFVLDPSQSNVEGYAPFLKQMQMKWAVVYAGDELQTTRVAEYLQKEFGIYSNMRVYASGEKPKAPDFWFKFAQRCVKMDIAPYIQIFNEPEDGREGFDNPEHFGRLWNLRANAVVEGGGYPGLQILAEEFLDAAVMTASDDVKKKMYFSLHNYGANHPPIYPYPNQTVMQDDTAVLRFLAIAEWFKTRIGFVPPMIGGEGGWLYQNADDKTMSPVDAEKWTDWHYEMFEWFRSGTISNGEPLPDYLFSVCPWLLYASNWYSDSWVNGLDADKKLKLIDKLANDAPFVRQFGARETAPAQPETPARVEPEKPAEQPRVEPTQPTAETYTIQGGDTLSAIGRKFGVSVAALVAANDIENPSLIRPGQALKIPRA
ncbi:MAG: hypothetical protein B6D41_14880 [Chloroflexi bacterium UTCFX4]|nr:MAG: hypothetical protein B6D41_14880 [Chloroflexi bacterium UTCFX4]